MAGNGEADKSYLYVCIHDGYFVLGGPRFAHVGSLSNDRNPPQVNSVSLGRILIIDDDDMVRAVICRLLVSVGYDVQEAASGKAALAVLRQQPADAIITDILMPDMEGLELIRAMRLAHPAVKIIAISGCGNAEGYFDMALKFGAVQVLPKPFTKSSLATVVKDALAS